MKTWILYLLAVCRVMVFAEEDFVSPILPFLVPIEVKGETSGLEGVDCIYVINLKERPEKWVFLENEFVKSNVYANRVDAVNGWKIPVEQRKEMMDSRMEKSRQKELSGGEIGCFLSHLSVYYDAINRGFNVVWICEDDIRFTEDIHKLSSVISELTSLDPDWDVLYTEWSAGGAGVQLVRPGQKHYRVIKQDVSEDLIRMHGRIGTHSMIYSKQGLEKAWSYFFSRYFWGPIDIDIHYAELREYSVKGVYTRTRGFRSDTSPGGPLSRQ